MRITNRPGPAGGFGRMNMTAVPIKRFDISSYIKTGPAGISLELLKDHAVRQAGWNEGSLNSFLSYLFALQNNIDENFGGITCCSLSVVKELKAGLEMSEPDTIFVPVGRGPEGSA